MLHRADSLQQHALLYLIQYFCVVTKVLEYPKLTAVICGPPKEAALSVASRPSVRLSVLCLQFSRNWKGIETSNLVQI